MKGRWEFGYWNKDKRDARRERGDDDTLRGLLRVRRYAGTLEQACDKMVAFADSRAYNVGIDYEVRDLQHTGAGYDCTNLDLISHPITELVD